MKTKKSKDKILFFIFMIMLTLTSIIFIQGYSTIDLNSNISDYEKYDVIWNDETGKELSIADIKGDTLLQKQITEHEINKTLIFTLKSCNAKVYIGDELVYSSPTYSHIFGKTSGFEFVSVNIKEKALDEYIKIEVDSPYDDGKARITEMYLGNESDIVKTFLSKKILTTSLYFSCMVFGIILILLYFPLSKKQIIGAELLYLGVFALCMGSFTFVDNKFIHVMYGKEFFFHTVVELTMGLIVIPILLYAGKIFNIKDKKVLYTIGGISVFVFFLQFILNCLGIKDLHETILLTHVTYLLTILYLLVNIFKNFNKNKDKRYHFYSILILSGGCIIDIILFNFFSLTNTSYFTGIGVILFLLIETVCIINEHLNEYKLEMKMEILSGLAYHDGLTQLLNRTSFIEDLEKLESEKENITIAMFDVNNLKIINDTIGHTAGDNLIIEASKAIREFPGTLGNTYRIGGDEFVVIIEDKKAEEELKEQLKNMDDHLKEISKNYEFNIEIAYGYAKYEKNKHNSLKEVFDDADINMYTRKKKMKEKK